MWDLEFIYFNNIRPLTNLLQVLPPHPQRHGIKTLTPQEPALQLLELTLLELPQVHLLAEAQNPVALKKRPYLLKEPAR